VNDGARPPDKPTRLSLHARDYIALRGFGEGEVERVIREADWRPTSQARFEAALDVPFGAIWNGR
jgi:hypothetical protein